ncbi:DUF3560 domain-containing protein [Gordonia sp. (in: high G+C Gram-positive bacteria)]|uniref:DUF3560 domain-containing protein n=1 Tax=Gordonia sp. (in: high G+C Gram-positive bacteria) TaxID=84139 RepID=UPI003C78D7FA
MTITISHTPADGTLVDGTERGDGTNTVLKAQGFKWFRTIGQWGIPNTRDRQPDDWKINRAAQALREAGHTVEVDIDRTHRDTATVEADKVQRAQDRAAALAAKADRKHAAAAAAEAALQRADNALPPGGEPIKIGHHSENRHRRAIDKARAALGKSVQADRDAAAADRSAAIAARATDSRTHPRTVANRIDKLEAEQRADRRALDGHTRTIAVTPNGQRHVETFAAATGDYRDVLTARIAQRADQLDYWRTIRKEQIDTGQAANHGPDTIAKGDAIRTRYGWYKVVRVNKKTVSVDVTHHYQAADRVITDTVPYQEITAHKAKTSDAETVDLDA